ncbi:MAG TPA: MFS transporter [Dehalococcoidia bacterium]|nr:MFS transporter [Dehalococcoidia bacterium]
MTIPRDPAAAVVQGTDGAAPSGHLPTLIASFLHFDLSFMLWVLLGALGIYIGESLGLDAAQKGFLVAVPILSGSLLRIPLGLLSDRIGGKSVGLAMLLFLCLPLTLGWRLGTSLPALVAVGLMLGTAGASFAVALPLASRWYSARRQGLVMGIAAAGNSGTVLANLFAPRLADLVGWQNVLGLALVPLLLVVIAFGLLAQDSPDRPRGQPVRHYLQVVKQADLWWFCLLYSVTFGGYVGLSSFLPIFFRDQYQVDPLTAGFLTALGAFVGSGVRPLGGYLADRFGGVQMLTVLVCGIGTAYGLASRLPPLEVMAVIVVGGMACLGMGNGAVFQLVPQRFRREIGLATGVVGALGGLGGFFLPTWLGVIRQGSGSYALGFVALAIGAFVALIVLRVLVAGQAGWRLAWAPSATSEARG